MDARLISILVVALEEIGNKTQLLSFLLAVRFQPPVPIILGIFVATQLNHLLAGCVGAWVRRAIRPDVLYVVVVMSLGCTLLPFARVSTGEVQNGQPPDRDQPPGHEQPLEADRPHFPEASSTVGKGRLLLEGGFTFTTTRVQGMTRRSSMYPEALLRTAPLLYEPEVARPDTRKHPVELSRG